MFKSIQSLEDCLLEKSANLRPMISIVRHHHEFYNGEGYPDKIAGNQIPIEARIVSVADAVEAMSSDRPYRLARDTEYIIAELNRCSGKQFDPRVVEKAVAILKALPVEQALDKNQYQNIILNTNKGIRSGLRYSIPYFTMGL